MQLHVVQKHLRGLDLSKIHDCWMCDTTAEQHEEHNREQHKHSPVGEYKTIIQDSGDPGYINRVLIGTPTRGNLRVEWAQSRYGQMIPTNWSAVNVMQFISGYIAKRYQVDDAQNLIAKAAIEGDFKWLILWEDDNIAPPDSLWRMNKYMRDKEFPVVSGLYYTKSIPPEPMIYRGRGNSYYTDWKFGDRVWVDGVPTGFLLISVDLLKAVWDDSEEYMLGDIKTRKVFNNPNKQWVSPETGQVNQIGGTSDIALCTRIMEGDYLRKSGWKEHARKHKKYPFLVDTNIFLQQVDDQGRQYPRDVQYL